MARGDTAMTSGWRSTRNRQTSMSRRSKQASGEVQYHEVCAVLSTITSLRLNILISMHTCVIVTRAVKHTATPASRCAAHSYGLGDAGTIALMSTRQWLQQQLWNLLLVSSVDSQKEGDKYSVGPKAVATWDVIGSIQDHMRDADDERLLHPPLNQVWELDASPNKYWFIHKISRCLGSPTQLPDVCQM